MTTRHLALCVEQLREIRAMLRLPVDATHEAVIGRIEKLGTVAAHAFGLNLVDLEAIPEHRVRSCAHVGLPCHGVCSSGPKAGTASSAFLCSRYRSS